MVRESDAAEMKLLGWLFAFILALAATDGHASTGNLFQRVGSAGGGGTISGSLAGLDGSGLLVTPTSATTPVTAANFFGREINVLDLGVLCDGLPHASNLPLAQVALDYGQNSLVNVHVILDGRKGRCIWGTDAALNTESPLKYYFNTTATWLGKHSHNINNSDLFLMESYCNAGSCTSPSSTNVVMEGGDGVEIDTVSRTTTQTRKYFDLSGVNIKLRNMKISETTASGGFKVQWRNAKNFEITGNTILAFPVAGSGQDGMHGTENSSNGRITNNYCRSIDDCLSFTEETGSMANKTQGDILVANNDLASYQNSAVKIATINSANGSLIDGITFTGNHMSVWGPRGVDGNCIVIQQQVGQIRNIIDGGGNTCDDTNGNGTAIRLFTASYGGVDNVDLGNFALSNYPGTGISVESGVTHFKMDHFQVNNYTGERNILTGITTASLRRTAADTLTAYLASGTDVSAVSGSFIYAKLSSTSLASNTGVFQITGINSASSTLTLQSSGVSSSTDEAGTNPSLTVVYRAGNAITCKGCDDMQLLNGTISNPPQYGIQMVVDSGAIPHRAEIRGNNFVSQTQSFGVLVSAGWDTDLIANHCTNFQGDRCVSESNNSTVSNTFATGQYVTGPNYPRDAFRFQDPDYKAEYLNMGNNPDWFSKVTDLIQVNSSGVSASVVSITSSLAVANVSMTGGLLRSLNVSATGSISATGNISANQFVGDGSLLTGITATASPGGASGQLQFNNAGVTSGTAGITYNPATAEVSFTGNVIGFNGVSGSRVMGTNAGTCSANTIQVNAANNGFYRPASNQVGGCAGGTEALRLTATAVSTSLNLTVGGTISTSLAGATSRSLCVSPNGAIYASPTCP